jgi:hypothetical protein
MADEVIYYRHVKPVAPPIPLDTEVYGFEHRSFMVVRENPHYMLWSIRCKDNVPTPLPLRSSFTTRQKAIDEIDNFLAEEIRKQNSNEN